MLPRRPVRRRGVALGSALHLLLFLVSASPGQALRAADPPELEVFGAAVRVGEAARATVRLTSEAPVQGFRCALGIDQEKLRILNVSAGEALAAAGAEHTVFRISEDGASLEVILDHDPPFTGRALPPGDLLEVAILQVQAAIEAVRAGEEFVIAPIVFAEEFMGISFPASVRVGDREIDRAGGLKLIDGRISIFSVTDDLLQIPELSFECIEPTPISVPVLLTNPSGAVQAFTLSVAHDPAVLRLVDIGLDRTATKKELPEFVEVSVEPDGGTIAVVLDLLPPFDGKTIPLGNRVPIAQLLYDPIDFDSPQRPTVVTPIRFAEGAFGDPPIGNLIVVAGNSRRPLLQDGKVTLSPCSIVGPVQFCLGAAGRDGQPQNIIGHPGQKCLRVDLFYRSPFPLQGLQMAIAFDDCLTGLEGSLALADPMDILDYFDPFHPSGIDFVNHHFDNTYEDGDRREFILGLLVDAQPPFEGQLLRATETFLKFADICFDVCEGVLPPVVLTIEFREGLNGRGRVKIFNLAAVDNRSIRAEVCQKVLVITSPPPPPPPPPQFIRGDCNASGKVEISDAAAVVSVFGFLYVPDGAIVHPTFFVPPCEDACDANDDGRLDLADAVAILHYLFKDAQPFRAPGPKVPGPDPTEDKLSCNESLRI